MHFKLDFEGNNELGAFICLTNKYAIVGRSECSNVINFLRERFDFPVVETTLANIKTVGSLCVGNKNGLLCSHSTNDQELMHIRNSLPQDIRVVRIYDKLNALGNNILCNDHVCIVNPNFSQENISILEDVLKVPVYKLTLGNESLVGSYGVLNNIGLITHPNINELELKEISQLLKVNAIASTVNQGKNIVGSGMVANDFICIAGQHTTTIEIKIAEKVLGLQNNELNEKVIIDEIIQ